MRYIKTYGIHGLLEWHGTLTFGTASLKLSFTNGTTSAFGVSPATYTTSSPFEQAIIEHSDKFRNGRIKLVSKHEIPEPKKHNEQESPAPSPSPVEEAVKDAAEAVSDTAEASGEEAIHVADKSEAVEWLKEHFAEKGYTGVKLRSKEAFEAACKECGVEFVIG